MLTLYKAIISALNLILRYRGMKIGKNSLIHPSCDTFFVNLKGITIGEDVLIGRGAWLSNISNNQNTINIGSNCKIGRNFVCHGAYKITIGAGCLFSYGVSILDHNHKFEINNSPTMTGIDEPREIFIGSNTFIGAHSFILKGVTLGDGCIVGANSVVKDSFPNHSIIAGSPARLIGQLSK